MKTRDNVNDKRFVKLESVMAADYIPFLSGRPIREDQINKDDLLNLKIIINQCQDSRELIAAL